MKIALEHRKITVDGAQESKAAQISASPTMMAALAGLYSDPILAICREYMTNMLDGYTRLKRLKPNTPIRLPIVHCPNALEPWVEFQDFGCGMDYDEVWNVYTTFGASTKQQSNAEVGGLGLGSKTAFTYPGADVWSVEARQNGMRHVIHCTKDDAGMPTFHRMDSQPTDLPDGVTVRLPVRPQDFQQFANKIQSVLVYYPMDVKIVGATFTVTKPKYNHKGTNWGVKPTGNEPQVIMGNVAYPVDRNQLKRWEGNKASASSLVFRGPVDLTVKIGDVDITPSREHLKYTDRTKAVLDRACRGVLEEIRAQASAAVAAASTFWEANVVYHRFRNTDWLRSVSAEGVRWRGKALNGEGVKFNLETLKDLALSDLLRLSPGRDKAIKHDHGTQGAWLVPDGNYHIFVDDVAKGGVNRLTHWLTPQWFKYTTLPDGRLERTGRRTSDGGSGYHYVTGAVFVVRGDTALAAKLSDRLGGVPVRLTSTLPEAPKAAKTSSPRKQTSTLLSWTEGQWKDTEVDPKAGGLYVRFDNGVHLGTGSNWQIPEQRTLAIRAGLMPSNAVVYGVPRRAKSIENRSNWRHFHEAYLIPKLKQAVATQAAALVARRAWEDVLKQYIPRFLATLPPAGLPADVKAFVTRAADMQDIAKQLDALDTLAKAFGIPVPAASPETPDRDFDTLKKRYPLLDLWDAAGEDHVADAVLYLKSAGRSRKSSTQAVA